MGNFIQREKNWFLRVVGKGKKLREIPVLDELLKALSSFRLSIGLPSSEPKFREKTPLIESTKPMLHKQTGMQRQEDYI